MIRMLLAGPVVALLLGCGPRQEPWGPTDSPAALAERIEAAHGMRAWQKKQAVAADVTVYFGGQVALDGAMVYDHHTGRSLIELNDGPKLVFDGEHAWVSPASAAVPMARFHLLTWPYFLAAPFKLRDPGTNLEAVSPATLDGTLCFRARLTFEAGVGDTPDDWYVLYADRHTGRLVAMAYIVTYGTPLEDAGQEPHAIVYDDFVKVGGVVVSRRWRFYNWSAEDGPHGDLLGEAVLSNVRFSRPDEGRFARPPDSREDPALRSES